MRFGTLLSILLVLAWVGFSVWYTPLGGPLTAEEIEHYVGLMAESGLEPEGQQRLQRFLEQDTGGDFAMVNAIELHDEPVPVEGLEPGDIAPGESSSEVLGRYMEYMWPALLRRASHPVLLGSAAAPSLDVWGIEGAEHWSQAGIMRYRSRRDMMEIATNPAFQGRHEFKIAAMAKTFAYPIDPWFHLGDPRLLLGMLVLIVVLLSRLVTRGVHRRGSRLAKPTLDKGLT